MSIKVDTRFIERGIEATAKLIGNNIRNKRTVAIGDPISGLIYADTNETLVYIHGLGNEADSISTISADIPKSKLIFNNPILIEQTASGVWVFYQGDPDAQVQFSAGITAVPDQTPVNLSQFEYGTLHPHSGMVLRVLAAMYGNDYAGDTLTGDFATGTVQDTSSNNIVIPTTNNRALAVMIQVTPSTGVLSYKQSAEFIATTSLQAQFATGALPDPDTSAYRIGYLKLVKGVTTADYSHIWQVPELYSKGDGSFPIVLDWTLTIAGNTQIVTGNFEIDTNGSLIIDGRLEVI